MIVFSHEISRLMGKTRVSVKSKLFNSGLNSAKDATGGGNSVAVAVVASSPGTSPAVSVPAPASVAASPVDLKVTERLPSATLDKRLLVLCS